MAKHLHIISFNVPYPADYGGVIDVFYRIRSLHDAGVKIHLHCFQYGREVAEPLNELCEEVIYYKRSMSVLNQLSVKPFIVKSRANRKLLRSLLLNNYPILFEGLHTCNYLTHRKLADRIKIVRCHNIEHDYYTSLTRGVKSPLLSAYFKTEAAKLKRFEKNLEHATTIAAISEEDKNYFSSKYGKTFLMRPCHPSMQVLAEEGSGEYILYHGDLSTPENIDSALFIIQDIVPGIKQKLIIAGKNPSKKITTAANQHNSIQVIANPTHDELQLLIAQAHVNLLPTRQATGFKLKLMNALHNGRFCVVTPEMVKGTGLETACIVATSADEICTILEDLMRTPFSEKDIEKRKALLEPFSNNASIAHLLQII